MHWTTSGLLAVFDGDRGAFFTVLLIALMIGGAVLLVVNLSARPKAPPPPVWEPVPDDEPAEVETPSAAIPPGRPKTAPRRRA